MKNSKIGAWVGVGVSIAAATVLALQQNATALHLSIAALGVAGAVLAAFAKALGETPS